MARTISAAMRSGILAVVEHRGEEFVTAVALGWSEATLGRRHFVGIPGIELRELP